MNPTPGLVTAMFESHGVSGPWRSLTSTGLANYVFATRDVVLRVATDHPEAIVDARTESIAAPVAHAAGILTPRLLAFDDSRTLIDRPFSLWERVHGETLGLVQFDHRQAADVWFQVGRELARLHVRVTECPDPNGYLDRPERDLNIDAFLKRLVDDDRIPDRTARLIEGLATELVPHVAARVETRFVHNDVHPMNIMSSTAGAVLGIIDWGDAGWGDPTLDFATIPLEVIPAAVAGYESETPGGLGDYPAASFVWDKLLGAMEDAVETPGHLVSVDRLPRFLRQGIG